MFLIHCIFDGTPHDFDLLQQLIVCTPCIPHYLCRKNELHQVAQQASNVEHLIEVIRKSIGIMSKQWSDAMHVYHEKFNALSTLIIDHGNY